MFSKEEVYFFTYEKWTYSENGLKERSTTVPLSSGNTKISKVQFPIPQTSQSNDESWV